MPDAIIRGICDQESFEQNDFHTVNNMVIESMLTPIHFSECLLFNSVLVLLKKKKCFSLCAKHCAGAIQNH